ncbi:MAG: alpha/beta hydrolase [Chloroflexota bacterium]
MRILKIIGGIFLGIVVVLTGTALTLYALTAGDYPLPATVAEDDTLPQITLDGVRFHTEAFGDPANPTVIVLHGGPGGDYRYLLPLQALADDYHVVFYDQRGTGLSERVGVEQLTLQVMVDDVGRMIDHYSDDSPVMLIGHSWGAMLAAAYTEQHPETVTKLVLAEPGALTTEKMNELLAKQRGIVDLPFIWQATWTWFEAAHISDPVQSTDYLNGTMARYWAIHPDNAYNCTDSDYESSGWRWGGDAFTHIIAAARGNDGLVRLDFYEGEQSIYTEPVLFIASRCNTWIGVDWQQDQLSLYPDAELVIIEDSGHEMFGEQPETSIQAVRNYLAG